MPKDLRPKSHVIREFLARYPEEGPTALANRIMEAHPEYRIKAQEVSVCKSEMKKKGGGLTPQTSSTETPHQAANSKDLAGKLATLKRVADELGGVEETKKILDLLG
jgi:hypothetical protein